MQDGAILTTEKIISKIKAGTNFWVRTNEERKKVLTAARFAGKRIVTRKHKPSQKFYIEFI